MSLAANVKQLNQEQLRFLRGWCARMLIIHARNHKQAERFMKKIMEIEAELKERKQEATNV